MDCYIVCNMFPPLVSNQVRAPGLRAQQLAEQAKPHFDNVHYVMLKSRYNLLVNSKKLYAGIKTHPNFLVIHDSYLEAFLARIEKSVFVFIQLEMADMAVSASKRHLIVYDMLASKGLELQCGGAAKDALNLFERRQKTLTVIADRILVNGPKLLELETASLGPLQDKVVGNPFCLVPDPEKSAPLNNTSRDRILFFSGNQRWTENSKFLATMVEYLEDHRDTQAFFMSGLKSHENPESVSISRLLQMPHVRRIGGLSYSAYLSILSQCNAVMDWSVVNDERRYSTSTRLIQAVSQKAAIFGNADTGLSNYWGGYPGATSDEQPTVEQLGTFLSDARNGSFDRALQRANKWNNKVLANQDVFGGLQ